MPTTTLTNLDRTRLKDILSKGASYESRFLYLAISTLLEEVVGAGTTDSLIDSLLPATPTQLAAFGGYSLAFFAGLSRDRIKLIHRRDNGNLFSDADVDSIYTALGIVESESVSKPESVTKPENSEPKSSAPKASAKPEAKSKSKGTEPKEAKDKEDAE